eukprot:3843078-Ditylum_brightwellii.AAC.1
MPDLATKDQWHLSTLSGEGVAKETPVNEIGNKVEHLILKLEVTHRDNTFMIYVEKEKRIKVATLPKEARKAKKILQYKVNDRHNRNALILLHVIST